MRALRALGRFCYDLVVGDDWKIAVAVVLALAIALAILLAGAADGLVAVAGGALLVAAFAISLALDTRGT
ncbi:hypothetical protein [Nocardioides sp.]|uniref:hypothetical protein n=1 Tax=Nocardioides sp. TaxID=35761 RepID=UPI0039E47348